MGLSLTTGWLEAALSSSTNSQNTFKPYLQILNVFYHQNQTKPRYLTENQNRFRVLLSDGSRKAKAVLAADLNHLVPQLQYAIVRINSWNVLTVEEARYVTRLRPSCPSRNFFFASAALSFSRLLLHELPCKLPFSHSTSILFMKVEFSDQFYLIDKFFFLILVCWCLDWTSLFWRRLRCFCSLSPLFGPNVGPYPIQTSDTPSTYFFPPCSRLIRCIRVWVSSYLFVFSNAKPQTCF
jgi:hypothetical protein